jgi:hypothetical protein
VFFNLQVGQKYIFLLIKHILKKSLNL